jgi:hypothetical protein
MNVHGITLEARELVVVHTHRGIDRCVLRCDKSTLFALDRVPDEIGAAPGGTARDQMAEFERDLKVGLDALKEIAGILKEGEEAAKKRR